MSCGWATLEKEEIPFHRPYPLSEEELLEIKEEIDFILTHGLITNGDWVQRLENKIRELYNVDYVIATSSCTLGIALCMQYLNFVKQVHMPNFTWASPYLMFYNYHSTEFHDINKKTWLVENLPDYRLLIKFPTHTFGSIIELEDDYHVIYDGAHALGSKIKKFGDATVLSLAPSKLITSCEGGLVLTNQKHLAHFVRFRRDKCARMSEIHALIGYFTLQHLDEIVTWKKKVYEYYKKKIPGQFQEIPQSSNFNTIGFLNTENLIIPKHIKTKQYYEPIYQVDLLPNSYEVFKKMVCLPSWFNCPYEQIVKDILEANNL